jgi:hypothetical protein
MMWTQDKSKTQERSAELKKIQAKYNKIVTIIKSCTNMYHIESCFRIINNFEHYCKCKELPQPTHITRLRSYTELKKRSIWLT